MADLVSSERAILLRQCAGALATALAFTAAWTWASPVAALLFVPLFAWFAARAAMHFGVGLARHASRSALAGWHGRYYEFAGVHLRCFEHDGELAFLEEDVLEVLGLEASSVVALFGPDERFRDAAGNWALTPLGCERLLRKAAHREAVPLLLWLQRQAYGPHRKKRDSP
ncbi:MAG TPA: hypothetical protein VLY46_16800 [Usitatibacter sp.]|nr:hypothetical protein [Usitatibacter sp.]